MSKVDFLSISSHLIYSGTASLSLIFSFAAKLTASTIGRILIALRNLLSSADLSTPSLCNNSSTPNFSSSSVTSEM